MYNWTSIPKPGNHTSYKITCRYAEKEPGSVPEMWSKIDQWNKYQKKSHDIDSSWVKRAVKRVAWGTYQLWNSKKGEAKRYDPEELLYKILD